MWSAMTSYELAMPVAAMRHDPASGAIVIMLRGLKMHGMAHNADEQEPVGTQRSWRRQARVMRATPKKPGADDPRPEDLDREGGVPPRWEEVLDRQESFIDELLDE